MAKNIYVSTAGNDEWSGMRAEPDSAGKDGPFRTLEKAASAAEAGDTVFLRGGIYHETLRPIRSGEASRPITFRNYTNEIAVISGADPVSGWREESDGVWSAGVEWDLGRQNQVFSGAEMLTEARWPNNSGDLFQPTLARAEGGSGDTLHDTALYGTADCWKGALLWCGGGSEWIFWSARVTGYDAKTHTLKFTPAQQRLWYVPRAGNPYVLMGLRCMLDSEGEWWFDSEAKRLHVIPPGARHPDEAEISMKRRAAAVDLRGLSNICIIGLHFRAAGILTDADSSDIVLERLCGEHVAHSYAEDTSDSAGVILAGKRIIALNCEFAYSSGSVVNLSGEDGAIINCFIHHGNYAAKWIGPLKIAGRRHIIARNTVRHSGRDLVNIHGLSESVIECNDLSDAGWLASDLGMLYGHNTDFGNTVIRRNHIHDNHAKNCAMGIYFDHLSHNAIVHHNIIWNIADDPIRFNNPGYFNLVFNNTCWRCGGIGTFDHAGRNDLFGCRYQNNIFNKPFSLPPHVAATHNLVTEDAGFVNPQARDFSLKPDSPARGAGTALPGLATGPQADIGACGWGEKAWKTGHDFETQPAWSAPGPTRIAHRNLVKNGCFELGTLESWQKIGECSATLTKGNDWGVNWENTRFSEPTGTSKFEARLGPGADGIEQVISGLLPGAKYIFSAWLKVSDAQETVRIEIEQTSGQLAGVECNNVRWTRKTVEFKAEPDGGDTVIRIEKTTAGGGHAWCDNIGLMLK